MALSADELVKRELFDCLGSLERFEMRVFEQASNHDQILFSKGGLTFGVEGVKYGSCDAAWTKIGQWTDPFDESEYDRIPVAALEATDALNRKSSGNAQYQRFHHALGALRSGALGIYYLRPGSSQIRPELFGMAHFASEMENGDYLISDNCEELKRILASDYLSDEWQSQIKSLRQTQKNNFDDWFKSKFTSWSDFARKRSTILKPGLAIKHAGRMVRNFTDSSQRAGHIAVGEMYLTKYFFGQDRHVYYLFPRFTRAEILSLDISKSTDKEWSLLRNEPGVTIIGLDDLTGVPNGMTASFRALKDTPLKGNDLKKYNILVKDLANAIEADEITIKIPRP